MPFNAALVPLIALAAAGLAIRDRRLKVAWVVVAAAGAALLVPALRLPDGILSPAATLGAYPPWQGELDPGAGNPALRDVTHQLQPWLVYLRRELRAGQLPFWNPHQFGGSPFWSNGQSAPLFPLHLLFAALPLQLGFVLLPWLRTLVAGLGAWFLARRLGLGGKGACAAGLIYPLSGMLVSFLLFPMGNALALVPWVLWAVEGVAAGSGGGGGGIVRLAVPLALASGLQLSGGHPETSLHTALLSGLYLLVRGATRRSRAWAGLALGWAGGGCLAAVHLLPLLAHLPATGRWLELARPGEPPALLLLLRQPLRLALPQLYGHPAAGTWWGPFNYSATAVYAGALALVLAVAGTARAGRDRRWRGIIALVAFCLVAAYHLPGVRDLLAALPLIGRAAQHRLLFGVELGLALLAGAGLEAWLAGRRRGLLAGFAVLAALLAAAWALFGAEWERRGLTAEQLAWTAWGVAASLAVLAAARLGSPARERLWPVLALLLAADLLAAHRRINPGLRLADFYPETGAVRFLQGKPGRVVGAGGALHPNAAMVYGLYDVRGDDPLIPARVQEVYAGLATPDPVYFRPIERWDAPTLDLLSVRWVVTGPGEAAPAAGWRRAYAGADATVWERPAAPPLARGEGVAVRVERRRPGLWRLAVEAPRGGTLRVAETWDPGWRARVDGRPAAVVPVTGGMEVALAAGDRVVHLEHRPRGLVTGAGVSAAALAALLAVAGRAGVVATQRGREAA
jgi:hypothetical protein